MCVYICVYCTHIHLHMNVHLDVFAYLFKNIHKYIYIYTHIIYISERVNQSSNEGSVPPILSCSTFAMLLFSVTSAVQDLPGATASNAVRLQNAKAANC